jgi:alpha-tubulin suppressor-like RCC1 family protein
LILVSALIAACDGAAGPSGKPVAQPLAINGGHVCYLSPDGPLCWGTGTLGQLGDGNAATSQIPVTVTGTAGFTTIAAGYSHTCALDDSGAAWCWGSNLGGELGTGDESDDSCNGLRCQTAPARVATEARFTALAAGNGFTCGLALDETILCWGYNDKGQLGVATQLETCDGIRCSRTPVLAASGAGGWRRITAGQSHLCALNIQGEAWCWGYDGHTVDGAHVHLFSPDPALNSDSLAFTAISSGGYHTCALTSHGDAWCWGLDAIGAGPDILEADHPVPVVGGHRFQAIRASRVATCGLEHDGRVLCWGSNGTGAVGVEPTGSTVLFDTPQEVSGHFTFTELHGGGGTFCGTTSTGALVCWGRGANGQLLNGGNDSSAPVLISPGL